MRHEALEGKPRLFRRRGRAQFRAGSPPKMSTLSIRSQWRRVSTNGATPSGRHAGVRRHRRTVERDASAPSAVLTGPDARGRPLDLRHAAATVEKWTGVQPQIERGLGAETGAASASSAHARMIAAQQPRAAGADGHARATASAAALRNSSDREAEIIV